MYNLPVFACRYAETGGAARLRPAGYAEASRLGAGGGGICGNRRDR